MINGKPVKNNLRTYNSIQKIAIGQGHDYTTDYLNEYYKMIAIGLCKCKH